MSLPSINPTTTDAWKKLKAHFDLMKDQKMQDMFASDLGRADEMRIEWEDFYFDYSKNRVNSDTLQLLLGDFAHIPHGEPVLSPKITITVVE